MALLESLGESNDYLMSDVFITMVLRKKRTKRVPVITYPPQLNGVDLQDGIMNVENDVSSPYFIKLDNKNKKLIGEADEILKAIYPLKKSNYITNDVLENSLMKKRKNS